MIETVIGSSQQVEKIVFLFHGFGTGKEDMLPLAKQFAKVVHTAEIHIPDGIEKCPDVPGRQWFEMNGEDVSIWESEYKKHIQEVVDYVNEVVASRGKKHCDVVFAGFSQGAMVALALGLKMSVAGIIAMSGLMLDAKNCVGKTKTQVLLLHGAADDVIPVDAMKLTEKILINAGVPVHSAISPTLKHGIDHFVMDKATEFLRTL